jgi:pteridine reductase
MTQVALITGAAARIGACIASTLHAAGYNVVVHYHRSQAQAQALVAQLNHQRPASAQLLQANLLEPTAVQQLAARSVAEWGRVDLLVNNASSFFPTPLGSISLEHWQNLLGTNALAPLLLCQQLAPVLTSNNGAIVNIIDSTSRYGLANFLPYAMAKAALANMTRSLARELAPQVRVNGVALVPFCGQSTKAALVKRNRQPPSRVLPWVD